MSSRERKLTAEAPPDLALLTAVDEGELPLAAALTVLARRPAATRALGALTRSLRARRGPPDDPAPWVAVRHGLADSRRCAPRAVARAGRFVERLRRLPAERRAGVLRRARREACNPALLDRLIDEACRVRGAAPEAALAWLDLARIAAVSLAGAGFPRRLLGPSLLRIEAHRANALRLAGELPAADRLFCALADDPGGPSWPIPASTASC